MDPYTERSITFQEKKNVDSFYIYLARAYYFLDRVQVPRMQNWMKYNSSLKEI